MKKLIFFSIVFVSMFFTACDKEPKVVNEVDLIPSEITKNVIIEKFTGEWCPACPGAYTILKPIIDKYEGRVFLASHHVNDFLSCSGSEYTANFYNATAFPSAMFDRVTYQTTSAPPVTLSNNLDILASKRQDVPANVGFKIETELDGTVKLLVGNNAVIDGNQTLVVMVMEDHVAQMAQQGTSDPNFEHRDVIREFLTADAGDAISFDSERAVQTFNYQIDVSNYNIDNLYVIAMIVEKGADFTAHEVLNVQQVKLGTTADWE